MDQAPNIGKLLTFYLTTGVEPFPHECLLYSLCLSHYLWIFIDVPQLILDLSTRNHINIMAKPQPFDTTMVHFVVMFLLSAQQYMISDKQGRQFLPNCHQQPSPQKNEKITTRDPSDQISGPLISVLSLLAAKRYAQAFSEGAKLKIPLLQELTRVAYEHHLIRYLLHTRDKIFQVNPEQHLLTEGGMQSLRTAGVYKEESMQAKANYAAISDNIRKLVNAGNFFQCTLPNKQELGQVKTALFQLFQENKNIRRNPIPQTQSCTSPQVTTPEKDQFMAANQFKEILLDIISLVMPTQTLRTNLNFEKKLRDLVKIAKDQIKEAFQGFRQELELVLSRAQFCQRSLETERATKMQRERQLQQLQLELISSQRYIEDLQGLKAATEMENLGLHSKIRSSQCNDSKETYQDEIQRLNLQNEQLKAENKELLERLQIFKEELQENQKETQRMHSEMNVKLERVAMDAQEQKQKLQILLQEQMIKYVKLQIMIKQKQQKLLILQKEVENNSLQMALILQKTSAVKYDKDQIEIDFQCLQGMHKICEDYPYEISKLQEELESLHYQHLETLHSFKQQQEKRTASQLLVEQLQKMLQQGQQEPANLHQQMEILSGDRQNYAEMIRDLQQRILQLQEQAQYISVQKGHNQTLSSPLKHEDRGVQTVITLSDLKIIQQSLSGIAERQQELQQLHKQNEIMKRKLYQSEWARQHT